MSKTIEYTVHSAAVSKVPVRMHYEGTEMDAMADALTIELVDEGFGQHGHVFRFAPTTTEQIEKDKEEFSVGSHVRMTLEKV